MIKRITIAAMAIVAICSCQKESEQPETTTSPVAVNFSTSGVATRVTQMEVEGEWIDVWQSGDKIGIYAKSSDQPSYAYSNVEYFATTTESSELTNFEATDIDSQIEFDSSSGEVTFAAYYPYNEDMESDGKMLLDVTNQKENPSSTEFLVASKTETISESGTATDVDLEFSHALAQIVYNITFAEDVYDISSLTATITNMVGKLYYDKNGEFVSSITDELEEFELEVTLDEETRSAVVTATLHPNSDNCEGYEEISDTSEIIFNVAGDIYRLYVNAFGESASVSKLESGKQYVIDLVFSESGVQEQEP